MKIQVIPLTSLIYLELCKGEVILCSLGALTLLGGSKKKHF